MKKINFIYPILLLCISQVSYGQGLRLQSMGGLRYAISDADNSLNPYDLGGNPAWLYSDQKETNLKIIPSTSNNWGQYKRKYEPAGRHITSLAFEGIKTLGSDGTFQGYTSYSYDARKNQDRALKYEPYSGEAFFMTDTNNGNFRYNGPKVGFAYSFEIVHDLFFGGSVNYQILDGLKSTYSRAETLFREVGGEAGLAYKASGSIVLGASFGFFDSQEAIECKSEELTDVEIFNFRGETYRTVERAATAKQKIKKNGITAGLQAWWNPVKDAEFGLAASLLSSNTRILFPRGQLINVEEGYAAFDELNLTFRGKYSLTERIQIGGGLYYGNNTSWSKNSRNGLKLWDWKVITTGLGCGISYYIPETSSLIGLDYEIENAAMDSSKFIDKRFFNEKSVNHYVKLGVEKVLFSSATIRAGFNYSRYDYEIVSGGKNVTGTMFFLGLGLKFVKAADFEIMMQFGDLKPENGSLRRGVFNAMAGVKLFTF